MFKLVEQLSTKTVLQIACGQQHSICRVRPGPSAATSTGIGAAGDGDVYTFGNGVLGQLGHGRLGTTRGEIYKKYDYDPYFQNRAIAKFIVSILLLVGIWCSTDIRYFTFHLN